MPGDSHAPRRSLAARLFAVRSELPASWSLYLALFGFALPLGLWSAVSYVPGLWQPYIKITDPGRTDLEVGTLITRETFESKRARLQAEMSQPGESAYVPFVDPKPAWPMDVPERMLVRQSRLAEFIDEKAGVEADYAAALEQVESEHASNPAARAEAQAAAQADYIDSRAFIIDMLKDELVDPESILPAGVRANPIYVPAPHEVLRALVTSFTDPPLRDDGRWLHEELTASIYVIFAGFALAMLVGIPLGVLAGTFALVGRTVEPVIDFVRYMPPPAFGVLLVAMFGLDEAPKIAMVTVGSVFVMVMVVANTTRSLDRSLIEAAQTLGASRRQLITKVIVPGILPQLYKDMRVLLGAAWTLVVIAEALGEMVGVGAWINRMGKWRYFDKVYAGILLIGLIGLTTDQVLALVGRLLFRWTGEPLNAYQRFVLQSFRFVTYPVRRAMITRPAQPDEDTLPATVTQQALLDVDPAAGAPDVRESQVFHAAGDDDELPPKKPTAREEVLT